MERVVHDEQRESLVHVWQRPAAAHGQHILTSGEPSEPGQPLRHVSDTTERGERPSGARGRTLMTANRAPKGDNQHNKTD